MFRRERFADARVRVRAASTSVSPRTAAVAISAGLSFIAFCVLVGPSMLLNPAGSAVGISPSSDYQVMTWSLEWWPWAIEHGVNPLHTNLLWPPHGFSTLWMTTIPAPALLGLPLTLTGGPLLAYNVLILSTVPLAAAAACLLCWELTENVAAAALGGLMFGLSPYMLGHTLSDHLDLTFVFPVPLMALLLVRYVRGKTTRLRAVSAFALLLLLLLGASFELFIDLTLLLAVGVVLALLGGATWRPRLLRAGAVVGGAYAICLPVLITIAVLALRTQHASLRYNPRDYATDLLNVVLPTPTMLLGSAHAARILSEHFVGNIGEQDGYLGIPLLVVAALAVRSEWKRGAWLAGGLLVAALVFSFGPQLTANGQPLFNLPFALGNLPLLGDVLPARMSLFAALLAACLAAVWVARRRPMFRIVVSLLLVVSLLPNFFPKGRLLRAWSNSDAFGWSTQHISPGFVADRQWTHIIKSGSTVLVLPPADRSPASYWQAKSGMRFALAVPATPFAPSQIAAQPIIRSLVNDTPSTLTAARLRAFLITDHIRAIVVARRARKWWHRIVARALPTRGLLLGGVRVYRVPSRLPPLKTRSRLILSTVERQSPLASAGVSRTIEAWLRFDGARAELWARLRAGRGGSGHAVMLSSPGGDADMPSVASDSRGDAAALFTEWRSAKLFLRVATFANGHWSVETLEQRTQPIWSPRVAVTPSGTVVAIWIDELDPVRLIRAATLGRDGRWGKPFTLEVGDNLSTIALGVGDEDFAAVAWRDSVGTMSRVRVTTYHRGQWSPVTTLAETLQMFGPVAIAGPDATLLRWRRFSLAGRVVARIEARRNGTRWWPPESLPLRAAG